MFKEDSRSIELKRTYYAIKEKYKKEFLNWDWDYAPGPNHIRVKVTRVLDKIHARIFIPDSNWVNFK